MHGPIIGPYNSPTCPALVYIILKYMYIMTLMDPLIDPKMDPLRLILGDPCPKKALQGPSRVPPRSKFIKFYYRPQDNGQT